MVSVLSRRAAVALLLGFSFTPGFVLTGNAAPASELDTEAAYLSKLAPFIEWPIDAFASARSPLTICVLEGDPMIGRAARVATNKKDGKRPIALRIIAYADRVSDCHILFLGAGGESVTQIAESVRDYPVLTVSRSQGGQTTNAMVVFVVDHDRVRFDIDDATAVRARLGISSKLLALARDVNAPSPPQ
jgi:hypothetical protein